MLGRASTRFHDGTLHHSPYGHRAGGAKSNSWVGFYLMRMKGEMIAIVNGYTQGKVGSGTISILIYLN